MLCCLKRTRRRVALPVLVLVLSLTGCTRRLRYADDPARTALTNAIYHGDVARVRMLLAKHVDVNEEDAVGEVPIQVAAQSRSPEIVAALLRAGANPNGRGYWGPGALQMASEMSSGNMEIAQELILAGADVRADAGGYSALNIAAQDASDEELKMLLDRGADPNHREPSGATALYWTALNCDVEKTRLLIEHGARRSDVDGAGHDAPMFANSGNPEKRVQRACTEVREMLGLAVR